MTNPSRNVRNAVRLALAACATTATGPLLYAQTAPAPAPAPVEEVVITGSRLAQAPNEISISPITSVSQEDILQTGLLRAEDILGNLPQIGAEQNSGTSISSVGVATVSLRSLGSQRTLVLINGKRMQPGGAGGITGGNANAADVNQIPAALIERADVLTGGASAVYGADAVAGVVNFVLNTHYQGVKMDANYSFNNHKNDNQTYLGYLNTFGATQPQSTANTGQNRDLSILAGANFADGKGNATVYATYLNSSPSIGYQFDHAGCTVTGGATANSPLHCGGSGTSAHGHFIMSGATFAGTTLSMAIDPTTGQMRPFGFTDEYNYGALSYFQRQADRWTAGGFLHYDVNERASVYSETMYARNTSTAQYGPSGSFFQTAVVGCPGVAGSVPAGPGANVDPLINAQEASILCTPARIAGNQAVYGLSGNQIELYIARRSVESGGRHDNYESNAIRQVLGVKGAINDVWQYDAYGQVGITRFQDVESNFLGKQQITRSLEVVTGPNGQPACTAALNGTDPACVPWNVWQPNGVNAAQLNYLRIPATWTSNVKEYVTDASVTGDLGKYGAKLPSAASGLNVAVGTEYRSEEFNFQPDYVYVNGLNAGGAPSLPIAGLFHVWEGFTEARLPLMDEKPGAYRLSLDAGYRYSSYTLGFNTNTYKIGLEWAPIQAVRFRGGYNRAVRAPNLDELYAPPAVGAGGVADPCWGTAPVLSVAQCALTGVNVTPTPTRPNGNYGHLATNSAAQINTQTAGNPNLTPEIADTYTYGLVIQPQTLPNLIASIDVFDIKIRNTITAVSPTTIVIDCGTGIEPSLCANIHRSPGSDSLWLNSATGFVDTHTRNVGTNSTKGADLSAHYRQDVGKAGRLSFGLAGTYTKDFILQPVANGGAAYDCVGLFGATCGAPLPKWRHVFTTNWAAPWAGLDVTLRWRHIGAVDVDRSNSNVQLSSAFYQTVGHIAAYNWVDLSAAIPIGSAAEFRLGVNNIADKNPPLIPTGTLSNCPNTTCNDNSWVGTYDTLGRYIFMHVGVKF
jgi:iron complex outermembrane receptor protein